jgi:hypothetical protein
MGVVGPESTVPMIVTEGADSSVLSRSTGLSRYALTTLVEKGHNKEVIRSS